MPRLLKRYQFDVQPDVGDDEDTPDDPLCLWCSSPNVGMLPYCTNCKRVSTLDTLDLDGMRARFTAGAPEDQIDEPNARYLARLTLTMNHSSQSRRIQPCRTQC